MDTIQAGVHQHYKGGFYQVLGIAAHSETDQRMVVYVSLEMRPGPRLRVRPASMWRDDVKWPDGLWRPRFVYVGDDFQIQT